VKLAERFQGKVVRLRAGGTAQLEGRSGARLSGGSRARRVVLDAYDGGPLEHELGRMVLDFDGLEVPTTYGIVLDGERPIALGDTVDTSRGLVLSGPLLDTKDAASVARCADAGWPFKADFSVRYAEAMDVDRNDEVVVNGARMRGPLVVATKARLVAGSLRTIDSTWRVSDAVITRPSSSARASSTPVLSAPKKERSRELRWLRAALNTFDEENRGSLSTWVRFRLGQPALSHAYADVALNKRLRPVITMNPTNVHTSRQAITSLLHELAHIPGLFVARNEDPLILRESGWHPHGPQFLAQCRRFGLRDGNTLNERGERFLARVVRELGEYRP
jgi:hypothetical protein